MMRGSLAAAGTAAFLMVAPGTVIGVIPWLLTRWKLAGYSGAWQAAYVVGGLLVVMGLVPLVHSFMEFAKALGTPMGPVTPTQHLVVSGFYRFVRNPMYVGLVLAVTGQALLFGSPGLLLYAATLWIVIATIVHWYEEPTLVRQFGSEYEAYRRNVRAWLPRRRAWTPHRDRGTESLSP